MKILILILFLSICINAQLYNHNPDNYYPISTLPSKILKVEEGELIFYGYEGNILRTYDNCETFHQSFSGTKSDIKKLIKNENIIFGVTSNGHFMQSNDKGDWWQYQKLSNSFSDIVVYNNDIVISTDSDSLFISSDLGKTWKNMKLNFIDSIQFLSTFQNRIIINTKSSKIYISNPNSLEFELINQPFTYNFVKNNDGNYYLYSIYSIAKLKEDLTWETHQIFGSQRNFVFLDKEDEYLVLSPDFSTVKNLGLNIFKYNKQNQSLNVIYNYKDEKLANEQVNYLEYLPSDIVESDGSIILSNYYRTILTSSNLINWYLKSNNTINNSRIKRLIDKDNFIISKSNKSNILKSEDGGKTFKFKNNLIKDTIDGDIYIPNIISFVSKNNNDYLLLYDILNIGINGGGKTNLKRLCLNRNGTLKRLDHQIPNYNFSLNDLNISNYFGDDFLVYASNNVLTTIKNENNAFEDSIRKTIFYKVTENSLDTLGEINDSITYYNSMIDGNKFWVWGMTSIFDKNNDLISKLFLSEDSCKTFNKLEINVPKNTEINLFKDLNGNYILFKDKSIDVYNTDFTLVKSVNSNYDYISRETQGISELNEQIFIGINEIQQGGVKYPEYYRFYIDENYKVIEFEKLTDGRLYLQSYDKKHQLYYKQAGIQYKYYLPIEPERLEYYSSVIEMLTPPSIWTYPPYPNPVKDRLKMKFYLAMMGEIAKLKVELIHIGTGRVYHIDKYGLNIIDDNWGEIEIETKGYITGAYLINFKLGDTNKSESIIIE